MKTSQQQAINLYKNTLDVNSKFYAEDLANFTANIKTASADRVKMVINNLSYAQSEKSDRDFNRETKKLEKGGMFNVNNMKPKNALD